MLDALLKLCADCHLLDENGLRSGFSLDCCAWFIVRISVTLRKTPLRAKTVMNFGSPKCLVPRLYETDKVPLRR